MKIANTKIRSGNIPIMFATTIIGGLLFYLPIIALYFQETLFTVTNVSIIFAVEAAFSVIFEVPTGAIADLFGRKKTLILNCVATLISLIFLTIGGNIIMFIISAIFSAFARSLSSGTTSALIYDSLKADNQEKYYKRIIGIYNALWPLGASIGSIIGGYLAFFSLKLTVIASFIPVSIVLILTFFLYEPEYKKENHKNILKHMVNSSKLIISNKQLFIIAVAGLILWGIGESIHRMNSLLFNFKDIRIIYYGYISAIVFGLSSFGHYISHYISEKIGNKTTIIVSTAMSALLIMASTLVTGFPFIIFFTASSIFFGLRNPVIDHLINLETESAKRATVISINAFMIKLGITVFAIVFGYLAELYTINTAVQLSMILLLSVPIMYLFLQEKT